MFSEPAAIKCFNVTCKWPKLRDNEEMANMMLLGWHILFIFQSRMVLWINFSFVAMWVWDTSQIQSSASPKPSNVWTENTKPFACCFFWCLQHNTHKTTLLPNVGSWAVSVLVYACANMKSNVISYIMFHQHSIQFVIQILHQQFKRRIWQLLLSPLA